MMSNSLSTTTTNNNNMPNTTVDIDNIIKRLLDGTPYPNLFPNLFL